MIKKKIPKIKNKTIKLFNDIAKILSPPPILSISEWADNYRILSPESSAEPGRWRTERALYQKEIMDAVNDPEVDTVVAMTSAQIGKTEIELNILGYYIDYDPSPIMVLMPTDGLAKSFSKKRLATMIRDTPALKDKVKEPKSRDGDNTIMEKGFPGGYVVLVGANSPTNLSSRPIRVLLADEVDRFPVSAKSEGDPLSLAEKRTKTFWNRKKIYVSTPTIQGMSRIEAEYEESTREVWCLPCPLCGKLQPLTWAQINFKNVTMECKFCKEEFTEYEWKKEQGQWISTNKEAIGNKRGFHLNALASPWERWETIIAEFLEAKKKGKEMLKVWVNTYLGETWEDDNDGEGLDEEILANRRIAYNCEVPDDVLIITAGVDVQDDRLEVEVVGWGDGFTSWGIEYLVFYGDPGQKAVWEQLDQYLIKEFKYSNGSTLPISCTCIDSGGHFTTEVYRFCKPKEFRRIYAIKGQGGQGIPFIHKFSRNNSEKALLAILGVDAGKDTVFSRLKTEFGEPGYCYFPVEKEKGYSKEYFKSLTSEKKVIRYSRGQKKFVWIKKQSNGRNEALDLRNYATAALEILKPNFEYLKQNNLNGNVYIQSKESPKNTRKRAGCIKKGISF